MTKKLRQSYQQFAQLKYKEVALKRFFALFLPEAIYRTTKIEYPEVTRKQIFSFLK
jgi:hypothetical protein